MKNTHENTFISILEKKKHGNWKGIYKIGMSELENKYNSSSSSSSHF